MSEPLYIWIVRWEDFQHYAPERDRAPAWIKAYTKQHDEDEYRALTGPQRAVLHDLRIAFARARGKLTRDSRAISQRIGMRVTNATLELLNHAGYIDFISRSDLEQRLDSFYASRARARAHQKEVEIEEEEDVEGQHPPLFTPTPEPAPAPELQDPAREPEADIHFTPNGAGAGAGVVEKTWGAIAERGRVFQ